MNDGPQPLRSFVTRLRSQRKRRQTRLFFATDVHGSERCFRKFLNARAAYSADILILGGDIAGKRVVPLVEQSDGWRANDGTRRSLLRTEEEAAAFEQAAADAGLYTYRTTAEELEQVERDQDAVERLFRKLARARVETWLALAEERLHGSETKLFINCGNDDPFELDELIAGSAVAIFPEGRLVALDDRRFMCSCGFANLTPWRCERDVSEEELAERIESALVKWPRNGSQLVLNLHCPPHDSGLDICQLLNDDLTPVLEGGQRLTGPAGSFAVRAAIERYQPILSLHGHIHESRGARKIGSTLALNPGSEYPEGVLRGAVVDLAEDGVLNYVLTCG